MRILISGTGIAGLMTAHWLHRYGFSPTIIERSPSLVTGGYKIDVRGTALDVLRRIGAHDAVVASSTQMQGVLLVDREGNVINRMHHGMALGLAVLAFSLFVAFWGYSRRVERPEETSVRWSRSLP